MLFHTLKHTVTDSPSPPPSPSFSPPFSLALSISFTPNPRPLLPLSFFDYYYFSFRAVPVAYGSSQAGGRIRAVAASLPQPQPHGILNALSKARRGYSSDSFPLSHNGSSCLSSRYLIGYLGRHYSLFTIVLKEKQELGL